MKVFWFWFVGMSAGFVAQGQSGFVSGNISDIRQVGIPGASVHVLNTNFGATTDSVGNFKLQAPFGIYQIQVTAVGYATIEKTISVRSGDSEKINLRLSSSTTQLDDVIVTAEKREDGLQSVPVSISALSATQVQEYRMWNSKDLTAIVPNLFSSNPGDNRNVTSIRGITSTSYDPAVVTYIDGVNQFGLDTYIAQLFDIERIEVLRGPQGTLYGRNAMGGVINIITKEPSDATHGFGEISLGNFGQQRYTAGLRTPLVKHKLFLGISGLYDQLGGFYTNQFNHSKFDRKANLTGNLYLRYLAGPRWSITFNLKRSRNRNQGAFPLASSIDAAMQNPFQLNQDAVTTMVDNILNTSLSIHYQGKEFDFTSQTAYQMNYRYYKGPIDGDFSPIDGVTILDNYGKNWNNVKVLTQELRFSSPVASDARWQWTAGAYLFLQKNPVKQATRFGKDAPMMGIPDSLFSLINTSTGRDAGVALFGQATYRMGERLDLFAGIRFDDERKEQSVLGEYQHDPNPDPVFATRPDTAAHVSYHAFSPRMGVKWRVNENQMIFGTYSRGYRTGGLTPLSSDPSQPPLFPYKPEHSGNIELGVKNFFFNHRLRLNVTAFYSVVNNVQVPTLILPDAVTITKNAGKLSSRGMELEASAAPVKGLNIIYNAGFTNARYKTLVLSQNGTPVDLAGNRQLFTPVATSMLAVQYSVAMGAKKKLRSVVRGEWMYLGDQYFDLANQQRQPGYSLVNARFGIATPGFEIMFWIRNMTNKRYVDYAYDFGAAHLGNPRNFGVSIRKNF